MTTELNPDRHQEVAAKTFLGMLKALGFNDDGTPNVHVLIDFQIKMRENIKVWNTDNPVIRATVREIVEILVTAFTATKFPEAALRTSTAVRVLVIRDPDYPNEFTIDAPPGIEVETFDLDLGAGFEIGQISGDAYTERRAELLEWVESAMTDANGIPDALSDVKHKIFATVRDVMEKAGFTADEISTAIVIPADQIGTRLAEPPEDQP